MPNAYLNKRVAEYRALTEKIQAAQTKAAEGDKGLSEEEFRAVQTDVDAANVIFKEIETLSEHEQRAAAVGTLAASLGTEDGGQAAEGTEGGVRSAGTTTTPRDPGHFRAVKDGGVNSWFHDMVHVRENPTNQGDSGQRLAEHQNFMRATTPMARAVTQSSGGVGLIPPKWLMDEYLVMGRQVRIIGNLVRRIPLGQDPRPLILPKQTAQVDQNLTAQTTEGTNNAGWGADRFTTNKDTLTPESDAAFQDVSRQLLDAGTPAADVLIMQDFRGAWDTKVENGVCASIIAGGTTAFTLANEAAVTTALTATATGAPLFNDVIDAETAVAGALYGPADITTMNYGRFGQFRKATDLNGRRLMPTARYNPQNSEGSLGNTLVGDIEGTDGYATTGFGTKGTTYPDTIAVFRSSAVLLGESDLFDFRYEQVVGPSAVRMGIWGYWGCLVRVAAAVQLIKVTAA